MSSSLGYTRKFIILKKEYATIARGNPKGHCKIEIKGLRGTISVNIENAETDNTYNVALISKEKLNPIWNLGKLFTDEMGKGKSEYVFLLRELESKSFSLDKISGILIMTDKDIVLGGYIEKEDGSIERYIESMSSLVNMPETLSPETLSNEEIDEPEIVVEEYVQSVEEFVHEEIVNKDTINEDTINEDIINEDIINEEDHEEIYEKIIDEIEQEDFYDEFMEPDYKTLEHIKKLNQKEQTTNYVLSILRFFPYIEPFVYSLKGYNWWLVQLDEENEYRAFLPYFSYIAGGNTKEPYKNTTTCNQLMNKYQHYLFGLYNEGESVKYFLYGIPGKFTIDEHPYRGASGFNTWYQGQNIEGYWIIYIDPMIGKPIYPANPMVPID